MENKKTLIAMSGGVDSSVAAHLMITSGHECIGATMQLLVNQKQQDLQDAHDIAVRLGIPFHVFDFTDRFREKVMDSFAACYECGLTPNPCIECNKHLKFSALLEKAAALGCRYIATGHYASIRQCDKTGRYLLYKAADKTKDQSYFLYCLTQQQLAHIRFPLGDLTKEKARAIAEENGFVNARKKDSQDICFIPDGDYFRFLKAYMQKDYPAGNFLDCNGNIIGKHQGAVGYTRGQRKGLGLAMGKPVYVLDKDMQSNTVTVGDNSDLFSTTFLADNWNFFPFDKSEAPLRILAKTRSRMVEQPATAYPEENGIVRVVFDEPQRAITTGQAVVLYTGDQVIGGGTITKIL